MSRGRAACDRTAAGTRAPLSALHVHVVSVSRNNPTRGSGHANLPSQLYRPTLTQARRRPFKAYHGLDGCVLHVIKSRYVFVTQLVCHYYVWGFSVELVQCYVPMFFVLASGLLGSGRVMTSLPGNYRRPLSTPTQVYRSCEVVCPADPLFPNFTNAADKPTFSDAAPLCPSSSTRRLFASWDFDDATRELDRSTGGTCWWNFDTRVSARTADASDAPPVLASGLGSGC